MTCPHTKTTCTNSRPHGPVQPFKYLRYRRVKCLDCGERFNTYEVTPEQVEKCNVSWMWQYTKLAEKLKQLAGES